MKQGFVVEQNKNGTCSFHLNFMEFVVGLVF
jgi:hypothetical protein